MSVQASSIVCLGMKVYNTFLKCSLPFVSESLTAHYEKKGIVLRVDLESGDYNCQSIVE